MGTIAGAKLFKPFAYLAVGGSLVAGGGSYYASQRAETCVRIPAHIAALSEPFYAALKADHIIIDGVLGAHFTYNPSTGKTDAMNRLYSHLMVGLHDEKFGDLFEPADLDGTTPSIFFVRTPDARFDHQYVDWRDLEAAGYTIKSTSAALQPCQIEASSS